MMESPVKKRRFDFLLILFFLLGVVGIIADVSQYNAIKNGTAEWTRKSRELWYFNNPDGLLIFTLFMVVIYVSLILCAIANIVTKQEKYRNSAIFLGFLIQIIHFVNKMIKG